MILMVGVCQQVGGLNLFGTETWGSLSNNTPVSVASRTSLPPSKCLHGIFVTQLICSALLWRNRILCREVWAFPVFRFSTSSLPPPQFPSSPASDNIFHLSFSPCLQWLPPLINSLWVTLAFAYFLAWIFWDVGTREQVDAIRYLAEWGFLGNCTNIWSPVCANRQLIEMWTQQASGGRKLKLRN